jgi:excisionase family DNA binding protein
MPNAATASPERRKRKPKPAYQPGQFGEVADAAALLRASRATVYRLIGEGVLPAPRQIGGRVMFPPHVMAKITSGELFPVAKLVAEADEDV